jgi:hypothetical protein
LVRKLPFNVCPESGTCLHCKRSVSKLLVK